jgi:nucleoside-diphosphate-sugar epimerase
MTQLYLSAFNNEHITIKKSNTSIMYIDDAVDFIINAALISTKPHYNIAAPVVSNYKIAKKFEKVTGYKIIADYIDTPKDNTDPVYISDIQNLKANWTRYTPLEEMINIIVKLHQQALN